MKTLFIEGIDAKLFSDFKSMVYGEDLTMKDAIIKLMQNYILGKQK